MVFSLPLTPALSPGRGRYDSLWWKGIKVGRKPERGRLKTSQTAAHDPLSPGERVRVRGREIDCRIFTEPFP